MSPWDRASAGYKLAPELRTGDGTFLKMAFQKAFRIRSRSLATWTESPFDIF